MRGLLRRGQPGARLTGRPTGAICAGGSLVEFQGLAQIHQRHPEGVRSLEKVGTWGTMPGQPTNDSETALALARTPVTAGRFDLRRVARA